MLRCIFGLVLILGGCNRAPPPKEEAPATAPAAAPAPAPLWTTESPDGRAYLQLMPGEPCTMACVTAAKQEAWALQGCLATANDLRFVSNDCRTAVLLYPAPKKNSHWAATVVIRLVREGVVARELLAAEVPGVDVNAPRFRWLAGTLGELGNAPRYSKDGKAVELEVMTSRGRQAHRLALEEGAEPPPTSARTAAAINDVPDTALYQWENERGEVQVSQGLASIPKQFRAKARPISADVAVIQGATPSPAQARNPRASLDLHQSMQKPPERTDLLGLPPIADPQPRARAPEAPAPVDKNEWGESPGQFAERIKKGLPFRQPAPTNKDSICREAGQGCQVPLDCCSGHCNGGKCE